VLTDRFGSEIRVGSRITYPGYGGSHLYVVDGVVTKIEGKRIYLMGAKYWKLKALQEKPTARYTERIERVTVVHRDPLDAHEMGT